MTARKGREVADSRKMESRGQGKNADERQLRLAVAQLPARMRRALRLFRDLTGFTAVTSLRSWVDDPGGPGAIVPPVHPRCALQIRRTMAAPPCEEQWRWHLRTGRRSHRTQRHVCRLGLRCSCVPIYYGETLLGTAKLVAGSETTDRRFAIAAQALELMVSRVCQDFRVSALTQEMEGLRREIAESRNARGRAHPQRDRNAGTTTKAVDRPDGCAPGSPKRDRDGAAVVDRVRLASSEDAPSVQAADGEAWPSHAPAAADGSLVDRALGYLGARYLDPALSLAGVSRALGVNDKYLTRLFTRVVGERMHAYILGLRVQHACRLLLSSGRPIKTVALESGFRSPERFRRVFLEHVGVGAAAYRRLFGAS
jgi:AraC-like DNA-binding protein